MAERMTYREMLGSWPWFMRRIFRGQHLMLTHRGRPVAAIIPVTELKRLESFELEQMEHSDLPESVKSIVRQLHIRDD